VIPIPISTKIIKTMSEPKVCIMQAFFVHAPQHPKKEISAMAIPMIIKKIDELTKPVSPRKSK
jgi:hypothetical protein